MKDPRRQRFLQYVIELGCRMVLLDWSFRIDDMAPADRDSGAEIEFIRGRKMASIYLGDKLLGDSPDVQRHMIFHELIHSHFDCADSHAYDFMNADQYQAWKLAMEYGVDAMAEIIAPYMPLPDNDTAKAETELGQVGNMNIAASVIHEAIP